MVILLVSCREKKQILELSKKIENLEEVEFPTKENQQSIFRDRNSKLRSKIIYSQLKKIQKSKSDEFYVIESYDYDWGYNYFLYLIIDGKIIGFAKDDFLNSYYQTEVDSYSYKRRIQLLDQKKYNEFEKLYNAKGLISTHFFVISKDLKILHSSIKLESYNHDDEI